MSKKKKNFFKKIPPKFDFIKNEHQLLDWWYKQGIVEKYLNKNQASQKSFSFLDGPITANNPMGVHHAWGRTLKDLYQRYKNMQGYKQRFQNGFDCQGLWVEVEVEKEKGFKSKKDIESYGLAEFIKDCKNRVLKFSNIQTGQSKRLGYFMDWDNSYYTMSDENNYTIWHFLKVCHHHGNIYKGEDVVPWCPRCGTAISHQEVAEGGYHKIDHQAVYMRFPVIKNGKLDENEFLLVWTTTPWTVPADTLVAVGPKIDYALVEHQNVKYWLAKKLIKDVFGKKISPIKTVTGKQLITQENITHYQAPFDHLPIIKKIKKQAKDKFHALVLSKELVNEEEGTGLVHIVPGTGEEDYQLVKNDLHWDEVIFPAVDESGNYLPGYGQLTNENAKYNPDLVLNLLKEIKNGYFLFDIRTYSHQYPKCWRCKTELMWRLVEEWYIDMNNKTKTSESKPKSFREKMIEVTKKINWYPDFGLARELDWLKNMKDWMISKKRYWGLALPIWECECGHFQVIGSKEELKEKAVQGWKEFEGHTPHRPWIDKVKIKCPECGELVSRIPDVGNPWLDAGIVPFSTITPKKSENVNYLDDQEYWKKWYPADFVTECFPGQFRNWFYSLIAMSTVLENQPPFQNLLGHALVKDEKGEEMHKSAGNTIWFDDAAEKMGVDVMRWLYARQTPQFDLKFGYNIADEVRRQFVFMFWNSYRFFVTYANLNDWRPSENSKSEIPLPHRDKPVDGRNPRILDSWILSRLENTKKEAEKQLDNYHHHLAIQAIETFIEDLSTWYIRRSRQSVRPENEDKEEINATLSVLYHCLSQSTLLLAPFVPFLAETIWQGLHGHFDDWQKDNSIHLQKWPAVKNELINKELDKKMQIVREIAGQAHGIRKKEGIRVRQPLKMLKCSNVQILKKNDEELTKLLNDELNVKEIEIKEGKGELKVDLETRITPELEAEGKARDLIRDIQRARQKTGLNLNDQIIVYAPDWPENLEDKILSATNAKKIKPADDLKVEKI